MTSEDRGYGSDGCADGSAGNWNDGSSLCINDGQKKDGRVRQDIEK